MHVSAFWNLTGKTNKTDLIRPLLHAIGLEGARAQCPLCPVWIRPRRIMTLVISDTLMVHVTYLQNIAASCSMDWKVKQYVKH